MDSSERPRDLGDEGHRATRTSGPRPAGLAGFAPLALPALAAALNAGRATQAKLALKRAALVHEDEPAL